MRDHSFKEAVKEVFPKIREMTYRTDSPCRRCTIYSLCGKIPYPARFETKEMEKPVEHFCETAHLLAGKTRERSEA